MASKKTSRSKAQDRTAPAAVMSYWTATRQPLPILALLLPLIVAYELCLALVLRSGDGVVTNKAHETLLNVLVSFGISPTGGLYLGGLVIVVVLLVWHILLRAPWTVDLKLVGLMAIESALLTLPLVVVRDQIAGGFAGWASTAGSAAGGVPDVADLSTASLLAISVGAGLYEELLFRMLIIAVVHTLIVDLAKVGELAGGVIAVAISALLFTWYHPLDVDGAVSWRRATFFLVAGLYFGVVYVARGFGIVVMVHALYDIVTVLSD